MEQAGKRLEGGHTVKILYFHQHFSTPHGSTGTRSYEFAKKLVERGHEVTMVCGSYALANTGIESPRVNGIRRGNVDGIQVVEIALEYSNYHGFLRRSATFLRFAWKSILIAFRTDFDLLFATSTPLTASLPGIVMRLIRPRCKFIFEVRDLWPELPKAMGVLRNPFILAGLSLLERVSYYAMDAGVALSPGILAGMRARTPKNRPIEMIPNGCDLETFRPPDGSLDNPTVEGLPQGKLLCVFAGAHGVANGLDSVLDAAAELIRRDRTDIQFLFVGDGKLKPQLQQRCVVESLTNCTFFDPLPKHQLARLLQATDIGLMILSDVPAFYYGTSPNKFFDYIASGMPVLNNYPGWLADLVRENQCGLAIAPGNAAEFADALIELGNDPARLRQIGRNSRRLAESQFDRSDLATQFVDFLERIAGIQGKSGLVKDDSSEQPRDATSETPKTVTTERNLA